ncbi:MMPL family transporter [Actinocorallia herbida]|uniref:MMPL family transporter n=1 Tax=Actinocorallia herbida TaxID=58109 RepID=UPI001B8800B8|nr:MMPL family transporter [Actinocorallia herbida]
MTIQVFRVVRWSAGNPWKAIVGWALFGSVRLAVGIGVGGRPATAEDFRIGGAGRAEAMAAEGGLQQRAAERVLITAPGGTVLDATAADAAVRDVARRTPPPEVEAVGEPVASKDGTALRADVTLKGPEPEGRKHVAPLLAQTAEARAAHPGLRIEETGGPSISKGVERLRSEDPGVVALLSADPTSTVLAPRVAERLVARIRRPPVSLTPARSTSSGPWRTVCPPRNRPAPHHRRGHRQVPPPEGLRRTRRRRPHPCRRQGP